MASRSPYGPSSLRPVREVAEAMDVICLNCFTVHTRVIPLGVEPSKEYCSVCGAHDSADLDDIDYEDWPDLH